MQKFTIGQKVLHKERLGKISSNLLGPECAGDYMCADPAYEITFLNGEKKQIEPKDLKQYESSI